MPGNNMGAFTFNGTNGLRSRLSSKDFMEQCLAYNFSTLLVQKERISLRLVVIGLSRIHKGDWLCFILSEKCKRGWTDSIVLHIKSENNSIELKLKN